MATIRLAVASDLHYKLSTGSAEPARPATAVTGIAGDPMHALLEMIKRENRGGTRLTADYLLCPGDIADRASPPGFDRGWYQLKELRAALGAAHLLAATGNHEVDSRPDKLADIPGNSEHAIDPLATIQKHTDYPCSCMTEEQRWIYWGRGYYLVEEPNAIFLVVNSSHSSDHS